MLNSVQPGRVVTVPAPYSVASGAGVLVGTLFGVAAFTAAPGADVEIEVVGVFDLPKTSAQAWSVGALVYWDDTNKVATTTASGNSLIGKALLPAANPSGVGRVRLNG